MRPFVVWCHEEISVLTWVAAAAVASTSGCSSTDPASLRSCATPKPWKPCSGRLKRRPRGVLGRVAETAVWRGTGVNAPTTLSRKKMRSVYDAFWAEFDYELMEPPTSCQAWITRLNGPTGR